jgi:hypothetical protein
LRYWLSISKVDPMLYRMARELVKPGAHVWDEGVNIGLFSFCAAALAGRSGFVLAIEPDVWLAQLINRSSWRWKYTQACAAPVSVACTAISDRSQVSNLQISERSRAASHLSETRGSTPGAAAIWCDVSPENAQAVFDILNPLGYELYAAAAPERVPLDRASWDTLALPKPVAAGPAPKVPC